MSEYEDVEAQEEVPTGKWRRVTLEDIRKAERVNCSKCDEDSVAFIGYTQYKTDIPVCYVHLQEARNPPSTTTPSHRVINVTITHAQYEQKMSVTFIDGSSINRKFKEIFAALRRKHNIGSYSGTDAEDAFYSEWFGSNDHIKAKYLIDKEKSTKVTPVTTHAIIEYEFTSQSKFYIDFIRLLYKVVDTIPEKAIQKSIEQERITDTST